MLGLRGVRTPWDEDTLGGVVVDVVVDVVHVVVHVVVDVVDVVVAGLVAWVRRCQDSVGRGHTRWSCC